jgi:hypothetical protein
MNGQPYDAPLWTLDPRIDAYERKGHILKPFSPDECTIRGLVVRGQIPYRKLGRSLLFLPQEIDAWLQALPGVSVEAAVQASQARMLKASMRLKRAPARKLMLAKLRRPRHETEASEGHVSKNLPTAQEEPGASGPGL